MQGSKRHQWVQGQARRFEAGGDPAPRSRQCCRRARASSSTHRSRAWPNTKGGQTSSWVHFPPRFARTPSASKAKARKRAAKPREKEAAPASAFPRPRRQAAPHAKEPNKTRQFADQPRTIASLAPKARYLSSAVTVSAQYATVEAIPAARRARRGRAEIRPEKAMPARSPSAASARSPEKESANPSQLKTPGSSSTGGGPIRAANQAPCTINGTARQQTLEAGLPELIELGLPDGGAGVGGHAPGPRAGSPRQSPPWGRRAGSCA